MLFPESPGVQLRLHVVDNQVDGDLKERNIALGRDAVVVRDLVLLKGLEISEKKTTFRQFFTCYKDFFLIFHSQIHTKFSSKRSNLWLRKAKRTGLRPLKDYKGH
jgi:hypothetical protein